ncbi:MAG: hypothetical protein ACRC14_00015, partial [Paracoccaceae bacterium]
STALTLSNPVRLVLVAPATAPLLAAGLLAKHLAISPQTALRRLSCVTGALAEGLSQDKAGRLFNLLTALGLRVRVEAEGDARPMPAKFDLSLQAAVGDDSAVLSWALAQILQRSRDELLETLSRPGGIILRDRTEADLEYLRRATRRLKGLHMAISRRDQAVFDLFARRAGRLSAALLRHLTTLGLKPCLFNGALASGLDRQTMDHVMTRFGDSVFGLERAFQRLDLYLSGSGSLTPLDVADFLATRVVGGVRAETLSPIAPLRIETGLSHTAARQFQIDYEMIGLQTFARLAHFGHLPESP